MYSKTENDWDTMPLADLLLEALENADGAITGNDEIAQMVQRQLAKAYNRVKRELK